MEAPLADRAAFDLFLTHHYTPLLRWLRHYTHLDGRCEDWCQTAFLKAWRARRRFDGREEVSWLYRIAQNVVRDDWRKDQHRSMHSLDTMIAPEGDEHGDLHLHPPALVEDFPEHQVLCRVTLAEVQELIDQLPPTERLVIAELAAGHTVDETAERWNSSRVTVRGRLFRARQRLRKMRQEKEQTCVAQQ